MALTVHHLAYSRSSRVIWLLEELGVDYELVRYDRDARFRAPASLQAIHPMGKAPVIVDDGLTIGESAVILQHIDRKYGGGRLSPKVDAERLRHEEWLHYVEGTAAFPILISAIGARVGMTEAMADFVASPLRRTLDHVSAAAVAGAYIMGETLTLADIQFVYVLDLAAHAGLLAEHKPVADYLARLKARPALVRAIEIGGPMTPPKR